MLELAHGRIVDPRVDKVVGFASKASSSVLCTLEPVCPPALPHPCSTDTYPTRCLPPQQVGLRLMQTAGKRTNLARASLPTMQAPEGRRLVDGHDHRPCAVCVRAYQPSMTAPASRTNSAPAHARNIDSAAAQEGMRVPQDFPLRTKLVLQHSSAVNGLGAKAVNRWILLPHHSTPSAVDCGSLGLSLR